MTGSTEAVVFIPIVAMLLLVVWLSLVFRADAHPYWKGSQPPARQEVSSYGLSQAFGAQLPETPAEPAWSGPAVPGQRLPLTQGSGPAVPGQRLPLIQTSPRAAEPATGGTAAKGTTAAHSGAPRRPLLLGEDGFQLGKRVTDHRPGRLDHRAPYSSGKRERCAVTGADRRPPLVAAGEPGADTIER